MINRFSISITFIKSLINRGHSRSVNAKKNILADFLIKGSSIAVSFILIPLTIHYVNPTQYGIWLTLGSIIGWFSFFDIGFGQGLRNKFTEALAKGQHKLARIYVSTTYAILTIIIIVVLILFFCINSIVDWTRILNTPPEIARELSILALIIFVFFCIQFVLKLITTLMIADQKSAKASFFNFLPNLLSLIIVFILTKTTSGNLIYLGWTFAFTPVLVLSITSIWFYTHEYKRYAPSFKYVKFHLVRDLMSLGFKFFIVQIGALILFQTDNIIIAQLFGPKEVTPFNLAFKLFSLIIVVFSIIMQPFWSAFTDAYTKKDFIWIRNSFYKIQKVWSLLFLSTILLLSFSPLIFKWWIGNTVNISFKLSIAMALYAMANSWLMIPCYLLNGIGKIKLQLYLYVICIFTNIPVSVLLGKIYGLPGVIISNLLIYILMDIVLTIQCKKIINNTATGIWLK